MKNKTIFMIGLFLLFSHPFLVGANTGAISDLDKDSPAYKAAERTANMHHSKKIQEAIVNQQSYLKGKYKGKVEGGAFSVGSDVGEDEMTVDHLPRILLFVSESMPGELLHELVQESFALMESGVAEIKFVLRGEPTIGATSFGNFLNPDDRGMIISVDPFLYRKLNIEKVPIVIFDRRYVVKFPKNILEATEVLIEKGYDYSNLSSAIKENV